MKDIDVIPRIKQLCKEQNMSYYRLAKESSITYSTLSNMLNRPKNIPTISTLSKICDGLNITLEDFFSDSEPPKHLTTSECELLDLWGQLNSEEKSLVTAYMKGIIDRNKL